MPGVEARGGGSGYRGGGAGAVVDVDPVGARLVSARVRRLSLVPPWTVPPAGAGLGAVLCPVWCEVDHGQDLVDEVTTSRTHTVTVACVATDGRDGPARVTVEACEGLGDGVRGPAVVYVECRDGLDPVGARELAGALSRAGRLVEDWGAR